MKKKRFAAGALMVFMCAVLCACGGESNSDSGEKKHKKAKETEVEETEVTEEDTQEADAEPEDTEPEASQAAAETRISGEFSVDVPAGWEFEQGDFFDENDIRYFSVKKSTFAYFDFSADGEENIRRNYDYNKNTYTNEQEDKKGTFGDVEWEGFQYSDGFGGYGFEAYTTIDGVMIRVSSAGFKFDAEETKTVLSSVMHVDAAEAPASAEPEGEAENADGTAEEAAPVYVKTLEMKGAIVNIPEGYEELKDAAPTQYVMTNSETGGKVFYICMSGTADDAVDKTMSGLDYEKQEIEFDGVKWVGAASDSLYCFATTIDDSYLAISIDYGATMEEMETLIRGVQF